MSVAAASVRGRDCAASGIGEQPVVADAVEAAGQNVQQEAADELLGTQRHGLVARLPRGAVILAAEGDATLVEGDESPVGDRHPVGVTGQIREHRGGPGERALGIDDPFALAQRCRASRRSPRRRPVDAYSPKNCSRPLRCAWSSSSRKRRRNRRESTRTGRKKPGLAGDPARTVGERQTTAGNDAMHVRMVRQRRSPGMQDQGHTDLRTEMLRVGGDGAQRLARRPRTTGRRSPPCCSRRWR